MTDESELMITKALEDGIGNKRIVELTQAHCTHAEFVRFGGRGMVEDVYAVPIGHHLMQCHRARSNTATYHFKDVAVCFYRDNCVACPDRNMVGLPNLATHVAELDRARDEERIRRARLLDERQREWEARQARREAVRRASTDQATRSIIEDIGMLDTWADDAPVEVTGADQAAKRLEGIAQVAPELYGRAVLDVLIEVARLGAAPAFRVLRSLLDRGAIDGASVVPLAFDHLNTGHGHDSAAACLVAASNTFTSAHVSAGVITSAVNLAGRFLSGPFQRVAVQHPSLLLACLDRQPEAVVTELTRLLGGRTRPRTLLLPQGETHLVDSDNDDHQRATAANAIAHLLSSEVAVEDLVPVLARALDIPDTDTYDSRPSSRITHTLARALLARPSQVAGHVERLAPGLGAAGRKRLFGVYRQALRLAQGDVAEWVDVEEDVEVEGGDLGGSVAATARDVIVSHVLEHLRGDWGKDVATDSAQTLTDLLRTWTEALDDSIETLLGHVLRYADAPLPPSPAVDPISFQFERMTGATNRSALLHRVADALEQIAIRRRSEVLELVLAVLGGPRLEAEVDVEVRTRLIRLVGKIGARPGALGAVVPTIYTAVLAEDASLRMAGIHAWAAVEAHEPRMPSTFDEVVAEALRTETTVGPFRALLEHLPRLCRTDQLRNAAVLRLVGVLRALDGADEHHLLEPTVKAVAALSRRLDPKLRTPIELLCLSYTERLPYYERSSFVVRGGWSDATRATATYAHLVLVLLSDPNVIADVNDQGDRESERVALRANAAAIVDVTYETIASAARTALEHRLPVAPYYVELLGAGGRWAEALQLALELHDAVPDIPRMSWARSLTGTALRAASMSNTLAYSPDDLQEELDRPATAASDDDDDRVLNRAVDTWLSVVKTFVDAADQLPRADIHELRTWSESLDGHAATVRAHPPHGPEWSTWVDLVELAAALLRWDAAVRRSGDTTGALATAARLAEGVAARAKATPSTPAGAPLVELADPAISRVELQELPAWLRRLATVPLPAPGLVERKAGPCLPGIPATPRKPSPSPVKPTAVCLPAIDTMPATWVQVLRRDRIYDLAVELRLPEWPDWVERLDVELVSVVPAGLLQLPAFSFARPSRHADGSFRVTGTGELLLRFDQAAGAPPRAARVLAWFRGDGRAEQVDVAGYDEVVVRAHDETRDGLTERRVVDERLLQLFAAVPTDVADEEVQAFARVFTAIVRQGLALQFDRGYKRGSRVRERDFHDDLERRLLADPALGGRLTRGDRAALGFLDLQHDGITAELKVERREAVQVETSHRYLGQPTQYATGGSKRLSILVVLDMAAPDAPSGVLSNYLGIMVPALHGLSDPAYPSLVGVVILNGNDPVPSAWSRRRIDATPLE